ncbi:hypothetical protein HanPSC8_Chr06g0246031 [Helianthus annuus]|nr:hypothetical protein HanPSC8_Chr06g0246031 [Helianthus annuus]
MPNSPRTFASNISRSYTEEKFHIPTGTYLMNSWVTFSVSSHVQISFIRLTIVLRVVKDYEKKENM